jgi:hypothetical protein
MVFLRGGMQQTHDFGPEVRFITLTNCGFYAYRNRHRIEVMRRNP